MKTGLVLEGGAMRGMFTAGVLDSWMDEQISFDGIVGVSAGCAVWDQWLPPVRRDAPYGII